MYDGVMMEKISKTFLPIPPLVRYPERHRHLLTREGFACVCVCLLVETHSDMASTKNRLRTLRCASFPVPLIVGWAKLCVME